MVKDRNARSRAAVWQALLLFALCWTAWVSLLPVQQLPAVSVWDKAAHALTYALLTGLSVAAFPRARLRRCVAGVTAFGIAIEVAQALGGHRHGEWQDVVANFAGAVVVALTWYVLRSGATPGAGNRQSP